MTQNSMVSGVSQWMPDWEYSDDVIDRMDLLMPCLYAYCPGCRVLNEQVTSEHPETLCTPALEINGTLRFWGVPASDDALRQALSSL